MPKTKLLSRLPKTYNLTLNTNILDRPVQEFIRDRSNTDPMSILLKPAIFQEVSNKELARQIEARNKCKDKLPIWFDTPNIYYPGKLNIEQTSSEATALYKAELVAGTSLVDITGGLGVDSYFFSDKIDQVHHCEMDRELSKIAKYNFTVLGKTNIKTHAGDGIAFLKNSPIKFDWIYVDPSRRNDAKGKVFLLSDCIPNIPNDLAAIFDSAPNIMIKTAPLLDVSAGLRELQFVKEIHVIAVKNEVKELLWILRKDYKDAVSVQTVNLFPSHTEAFRFMPHEEKLATSSFSQPLGFLYEPNASILKSGAFKTVGNQFKLYKLHEHTHLYTHKDLIAFPGRVFRIEREMAFNKKEIQQLQLKKANITIRNFPMSVAEIRKKFKIKDGGEDYLFFTTNMNGEKIVIHCHKA